MNCALCEIIERKDNILYQDDLIIVAMKDVGFTPGQVTIFTREHHTILEQVPEKALQKCAVMANKVSTAVFESLGSQGTNSWIKNGLGAGQTVPHFSIEVIPRQEEDGLSFLWEGRQLDGDEQEIVAAKLTEGIKEIEKIEKEVRTEKVSEKKKISGDNYLLRSLKRKP